MKSTSKSMVWGVKVTTMSGGFATHEVLATSAAKAIAKVAEREAGEHVGGIKSVEVTGYVWNGEFRRV